MSSKLENTAEIPEEYDRAMARALNLLARRQHAARELETKLLRTFEQPVIQRVLARLSELGHVDDPAFAREYARQRFKRSPRAALAVVSELIKRGVRRGTAEEAVALVLAEEGLEENLLAETAARKKLASFQNLEPSEQKIRLFRFLSSRGFAKAVALRAVKRILAPTGKHN